MASTPTPTPTPTPTLWLRAAWPLAAALMACITPAALHAQRDSAAALNDSASTAGIGRELPWPRTLHSGGATLTVHAPQVDDWDGFDLAARLAVRVTRDGSPAAYGVVTIKARTLTDKGARVVMVHDAHATDTRFPGLSHEEARRLGRVVASGLTGRSRLIALDRLETSFAASEHSFASGPASDTLSARILVSTEPALLVSIDGPPEYHRRPGARFERIVNTRALVLHDTGGVHYLRLFNGWLRASSLQGPWSVVADPPDRLPSPVVIALDAALASARDARVIDELAGRPLPNGPPSRLADRRPAIHVATRPTELLVVDGAPNWTPVPGVRVFYLLNTTGRVLKSGQDFRVYALLAGRWYRARTLSGPWTRVRANALPSDFAKIPDDSPIENVKASIAGTSQAREAAVAATIAQTAAIIGPVAHLWKPRFDGAPSFRTIKGTRLEYAANTATPIVRTGDTAFYAVENGVWFRADSLAGPWSVASSIPDEISLIPPASPLYHLTFVHVYATVGDTVFVGYTPGYEGTYVDSATHVVVFGTGERYRPWIDRRWYGGPVTSGLAANLTFTPWTGWRIAFGLGWSWGGDVLAPSWGWGLYPWWSPWSWGWAYGPSEFPWHPAWEDSTSAALAEDIPSWDPGGWLAYSGDIYRSWKDRGGLPRIAGVDVWTTNAWVRLVGLSYNSRTGLASSGQHGAIESVTEGGLALRARTVAVTPEGQLVAAARSGGFGVLPRDRVRRLRPGESGAALREIPEEHPHARLTAAPPPPPDRVEPDEPGGPRLFAGPGRLVYQKTHDGWARWTTDGWEGVRQPDESLPRAARMRELGGERVTMLRVASERMRESLAMREGPPEHR